MKFPSAPSDLASHAAQWFPTRLLAFKFVWLAAFVTFCLFAFVYGFWDDFSSSVTQTHDPRPAHTPATTPATATVPNTDIPKIIWRKMGPAGLSKQLMGFMEGCTKINPEYKMELMTDASADAYVTRTFSESRRDVVDTYMGLAVPILKADLLRYLLLVDQGGIWADLDVSCSGPPIDEWIPAHQKHNASLVVGLEYDMEFERDKFRQFETWTIMARPNSPHLWQVVDDILARVQASMAEHNVLMGELTKEMVGNVIDFTGPKGFTRSILTSLERQLNRTIPVTERAHLLTPKPFGDVLIMPGFSFSKSVNHYGKDAEGKELPAPGPVLVEHHYLGSWKNKAGGETKRGIPFR